MRNEIKVKSGVKRFLLNQHIKFATWALMLMPILFMFFASEHGDYFYKYAIPIAMFVALSILANGRTKQIKGGKAIHRRYKYRYVFLLSVNFACTLLYSLLDYYFYDKDYLHQMIVYDCFYAVVCSPVIVVRTYYSRGLDLLDYIYRNYEENIGYHVIGMVAGFYVVLLGSLFIITWLGLNKVIFSSHIIDSYELIVITIIELLLFLVGYFLYVLYKKKHDDYILYK